MSTAFNSSVISLIKVTNESFLWIKQQQQQQQQQQTLRSSWPDPAFLRTLSSTSLSPGASHTPRCTYLLAVLTKGGHTSGVCMKRGSCHIASTSETGSTDTTYTLTRRNNQYEPIHRPKGQLSSDSRFRTDNYPSSFNQSKRHKWYSERKTRSVRHVWSTS